MQKKSIFREIRLNDDNTIFPEFTSFVFLINFHMSLNYLHVCGNLTKNIDGHFWPYLIDFHAQTLLWV